jgi:hypothetical protein
MPRAVRLLPLLRPQARGRASFPAWVRYTARSRSLFFMRRCYSSLHPWGSGSAEAVASGRSGGRTSAGSRPHRPGPPRFVPPNDGPRTWLFWVQLRAARSSAGLSAA